MSEEKAAIEALAQRVESEYKRLRESAELVQETRELGNVSTTIAGLPGEIEKLRERGYAFAGYLTARANSLAQQWNEVRVRIESQIRTETGDLNAAVLQVDPVMSKIGLAPVGPAKQNMAKQAEERLSLLEDDIKSAQSRIEALYGGVGKDSTEIKRQLTKFNWYMDAVEEATFEFGATEAVYIVTKAEWIKTGKGKKDPDGLLYLTDQRLIFERREKEGGFLGMGGKKVQGIEWEVSLSAVETVTSDNKGLFGNKDIVHFEFSSGGPASPTTLEVKGDVKANWYAQQVERAAQGEIDQERALEVPEEVLEAIRNAPTACENCGAPFTVPITRSMTQLVCEYCGSVTRVV